MSGLTSAIAEPVLLLERMVRSNFVKTQWSNLVTELDIGINASDVLHLTPKFWQYHQDPIVALDMAAFTLMRIQYNLVAGTLAPFAIDGAELRPILDRILNFDIS
jgi:hypothetical protein